MTMRSIETSIEIAAPLERVWAILSDLSAYHEWNPLIREASGDLQPGGLAQLFIATPGLAKRRVAVRVLALDPLKEIRWLGRLLLPGVLDGDHRFVLSPLSAGRVRVVQQEAFRGLCVPFVERWLLPKMTLGFQAMNEALRQRAEAPVPG